MDTVTYHYRKREVKVERNIPTYIEPRTNTIVTTTSNSSLFPLFPIDESFYFPTSLSLSSMLPALPPPPPPPRPVERKVIIYREETPRPQPKIIRTVKIYRNGKDISNYSDYNDIMLKSELPQVPSRTETRVIRLTAEQEAVLQEQFNRWPKTPHNADVVLLAAETGLSEEDVHDWYSIRLAQWRKEQGLGGGFGLH